MNIVIVGGVRAGKIGETLCDEGHRVYLLFQEDDGDKGLYTHQKIKVYPRKFHPEDTPDIPWSSIDYGLCLTDEEETNLLWSSLLKRRGVKETVVLVHRLSTYRQMNGYMGKVLGDHYVHTGTVIASILGRFFQRDTLPGESYWDGTLFLHRKIVNTPSLTGKTLETVKDFQGALIVGILRGGDFFIPRGDTVLEDRDVLYVLGKREGKRKEEDVHDLRGDRGFWIIGDHQGLLEAGEILSERNFPLRITLSLTGDRQKWKRRIPGALVEKRDLMHPGLYASAERCYRGILLGLSSPEETAWVSLLAEKAGAQHIVSLHDEGYSPELHRLPVDLFFNGKRALDAVILREIRENPEISIYPVFGENTEVIDAVLPEDSPLVGETLRRIDPVKGAVVGGIRRKDGEILIPDGDTVLWGGDRLLIFAQWNVRRKVLSRFTPGGGIVSRLLKETL